MCWTFLHIVREARAEQSPGLHFDLRVQVSTETNRDDKRVKVLVLSVRRWNFKTGNFEFYPQEEYYSPALEWRDVLKLWALPLFWAAEFSHWGNIVFLFFTTLLFLLAAIWPSLSDNPIKLLVPVWMPRVQLVASVWNLFCSEVEKFSPDLPKSQLKSRPGAV